MTEPKLIDVSHLGDFDALVLMRSRDNELCFLIRKDMPEEAFLASCKRLRERMLSDTQ